MTATADQHDQDRLDDLWDAVARGGPLHSADSTERLQAETLRSVHAADATPRPDPRFLRDLRRTLMEMTPAAARSGGPFPLAGPAPAVTPIRRPSAWRRLTGVSTRRFEIAATIVVLFATLAFIVANGNLPGLLDRRQIDPGETAMYLGTAARTGEMPGPGPDGEIGLRWRFPDGARDWSPASSPVVVDGVVYIAVRNLDRTTGVVETRMAALDLATGHPIWESPLPELLGDGVSGGPAVANGLVYLGVSNSESPGGTPATAQAGGALVALDARTGERVWTYETGKAWNFAPAVAGGTAYVVDEEGTLHAVDATTGERRWSVSSAGGTSRGLATSPAVAGDTVYVAGSQGRLYAFDAATGAERWSAVVGNRQPTNPVVAGDTVVVGAFLGVPSLNSPSLGTERFTALDVATGSTRWSVELVAPDHEEAGQAPTVARESVLLTGLGLDGSGIEALSVEDGSVRWRAMVEGEIITPATWSGETAYVGSWEAKLYALDLTTGAVRWNVATGDGIPAPAFVVDGLVVFGSWDGNIYAAGSVEPGAATPAATSVAGGDLSGLPPCDVEPRSELDQTADGVYVPPFAGTPRASIVSASKSVLPGTILWSELPDGEPASPDVTAAIQATIAAMAGCGRPGDENRLAAYFSDDYFRRPSTKELLRLAGYVPAWIAWAQDEDFDRAFVLPDGRIALVFRLTYAPSGQAGETIDSGHLVVWIEQDGRWLVDEVLNVIEEP